MFIAAASGYLLATAQSEESVHSVVYSEAFTRGAEIDRRLAQMRARGASFAETEVIVNRHIQEGVAFERSLARFWPNVALHRVPGEEWVRA